MRIGISGHRDLSAETGRGMGDAIRALLAERVRVATRAGRELTGVSCLADGADQIFAQAVLDLGGRLQVIVPAAGYRDQLPAISHDVYDSLVAQAAEVLELPFMSSGPRAFMAASRAMLDRIDLLLAVWDGEPARGFGGTADVVREARDREIPVTVIWPAGADRTGSEPGEVERLGMALRWLPGIIRQVCWRPTS